MKIIKWKIGDNSPLLREQLAVAIGNFDGIHQGHIKLLNECKLEARANNLSFGVVTFDPHPRDFFNLKNPSCLNFSFFPNSFCHRTFWRRVPDSSIIIFIYIIFNFFNTDIFFF